MTRVKKILYLGWIGQANVGDEVLFEVFKTLFYLSIDRNKTQCEFRIDGYQENQHYKIDISAYDLVVLGGGSIFQFISYLNLCKNAQFLEIPTVSFGTGMDGLFAGNSAAFDANSFLNHQDPHLISILFQVASNMKLLSVRGPFTKAVLCSTGIEETQIDVVSDPALFYDENRRAVPSGESNRVLVNWGTSFNHVLGKNEERVERELAIAIRSLIERGFDVTVYPVWWRDVECVIRLADRVDHAKCKPINVVYDAHGLASFLANSAFTVNFKLHANIMAAAVGVPFISLAYRGKCFEFAETLHCNDLAIGTDKASARAILEKIQHLEVNRGAIEKQIEHDKQFYRSKINSFCKKMVDLI